MGTVGRSDPSHNSPTSNSNPPLLPSQDKQIKDLAKNALNAGARRTSSDFNATSSAGNPKARKVAEVQLASQSQEPLELSSIEAPTRKAPTKASMDLVRQAKEMLAHSRNIFTSKFEKRPIDYEDYEKFAGDIAFQERRINGSRAPLKKVYTNLDTLAEQYC